MTRSRLKNAIVGSTLLGASLTACDSCFGRGTQVSTPRGPRRIESLAVGDPILSWDPVSGRSSVRAVAAIRSARRRDWVSLEAGGLVVQRVTLDHPLYEARAGRFVEVGDLSLDAQLLAWDGEGVRRARVTQLERGSGEEIEVFDLSIDGPEHDFFADGLLAHNKRFPPRFDAGPELDAGVIVDAGPIFDSSCFARGTRILTPQGARRVEELREGDEVISWHEQTHAPRTRKLASVIIGKRAELVRLCAGEHVVEGVTTDHPLYEVERRAYVEVGALTLRSTLSSYHDGVAHPAAVRALVLRAEDAEVYDLSVDGEEHNFFAEGLLAHNKTPDAGGRDAGDVDAGDEDGGAEDGGQAQDSGPDAS